MKGSCPECNRVVTFSDVRVGRCSHCNTKICIPRRYYQPVSTGACIFTLFVVAGTGSLVWVSPPVFSHLILWLFLLVVTFYVVLFALAFIWVRISPPPIERIHANDSITRLRLDD